MASIVFTMASGKVYSTADSPPGDIMEVVSKLVSTSPREFGFVSTGIDNILLSPLHIESIQVSMDGEV